MTREVRHGRKRYELGCRCETCKAAKARAWKQYASCRRCGVELIEPTGDRVCGFCLEEERFGITA